MSCPGVRFSLLLSLLLAAGVPAATEEPSVRELLEQVGIPPEGDRRGQMDIVGYATTAEQMDRVISEARRLAADRSEELRRLHGITDTTTFVAGVSPHDDYCYAARLYALVLPHIRAKRVILFGVFHKARLFHCRDRLVFDSFRTWRGPYGDDLRERRP